MTEAHRPSRRTVNILGAGFNLGQPLPGVQEGPAALLENHLMERIQALGWSVHEVRNLDFSHLNLGNQSLSSDLAPIHHVHEAGAACRLIAHTAEMMTPTADFNLVIGGDHSIAIGSIAGISKASSENLRVIWVDAHADFNTPTSSKSHNLHGMPLSALTNVFDLSQYPNFEFFAHYPKLKPEHVAIIGARSVDPPELTLLEEAGVHLYTMTEIDEYGIAAVIEDAFKRLAKDESGEPLANCHFHLSYDIDALDPSIAPNTGTCVTGGLTYREAHYIAEYMSQTKRLKSMDLVEVNPVLGKADYGSTINIALELIESALGKRIAAPRKLLGASEGK